MNLDKFLNSKRYIGLIIGYVVFTCLIAIIGFGELPHGKRIFTNTKGSMEPLISKNSLTVVEPSDYYDVGDIISYYKQEGDREIIVTHRINQVGGNVYVTKGDYNQAVDSEVVRPRLVIGKVILIVPWLGLIFSVVKSAWGTCLFLLLPAVLIISWEINRIKILIASR